MLGTMIESCGDTLEESHMPLGWPLSIDGAVRQFCMHKRATIQELNDMLAEFNLQRSSVEINRNTTLWSHNSVWNKRYMDPYPGHTLKHLWDASEHYICRKASRSREVPEEAILLFFFSSSLAVNALWHGPDRYISGEKRYSARLACIENGRHIKFTNTKRTTKTRRPANPPARFAFRLKPSKTTRKTGPGPTENTHT